MRKVPAVLRQARKAIADLDLLKVLQSEINHEFSAKTFQKQLVSNKKASRCCQVKASVTERKNNSYVTGSKTLGNQSLYHRDELSTPQSHLEYDRGFPCTNIKGVLCRSDRNKKKKNDESSSFGDFVVDWDSPQSQDVLLRRRCESGEEVAVSAFLGAAGSNENAKFPREAFMKVGVKKPGLRSLLQFDCVATAQVGNGCEVQIQNVNYIPSLELDSSACKGPNISFFSSSDQRLQDEFHKYLEARGVGKSFTESLLLHLHKKEQGQYVEWLHKLQGIVTPSESCGERPMQDADT